MIKRFFKTVWKVRIEIFIVLATTFPVLIYILTHFKQVLFFTLVMLSLFLLFVAICEAFKWVRKKLEQRALEKLLDKSQKELIRKLSKEMES